MHEAERNANGVDTSPERSSVHEYKLWEDWSELKISAEIGNIEKLLRKSSSDAVYSRGLLVLNETIARMRNVQAWLRSKYESVPDPRASSGRAAPISDGRHNPLGDLHNLESHNAAVVALNGYLRGTAAGFLPDAECCDVCSRQVSSLRMGRMLMSGSRGDTFVGTKDLDGSMCGIDSEPTDSSRWVQYSTNDNQFDMDLMVELDVHVGLEGDSTEVPKPGEGKLFAQESSRYRGYYRLLCRPSPECLHREPLHIPAQAVKTVLDSAVRSIVGEDGDVTQQGPAITYVSKSTGQETDLVSCVRVSWPRQWRAELCARPKPSGWPSGELLQRLGSWLHLVPVGPFEGESDLWRLSYSQPEAALSQALPAAVHRFMYELRRARRACKQYRSQHLGEHGGLLSSYHLKTAVYWLCERRPAVAWEDRAASARAVVDWLAAAVAGGTLPCYLRPDVCALRDPSAQRLRRLHDELQWLRRWPFGETDAELDAQVDGAMAAAEFTLQKTKHWFQAYQDGQSFDVEDALEDFEGAKSAFENAVLADLFVVAQTAHQIYASRPDVRAGPADGQCDGQCPPWQPERGRASPQLQQTANNST